MRTFLLAGLAAEPALWRLAAPGARTSPDRLQGLVLQTSPHGPWPEPAPGAGEIAALALEVPPEEAGGLAHLLASLGLSPRAWPGGEVWCAPAAGTLAWQGALAPEVLPEVLPVVLRVVLAFAADALALRGAVEGAAIARRIGPMLVRAASRLRAEAEVGPTGLRRATGAGDVVQAGLRQPYGHFFAIEEADLAWRRFDGTMSGTATRASFLSGDAVTVLPYDPVRDRVLVVEQFRAGPLARGDRQLWQIEAIAGRVDPFETPQEAARREAVEEAGLTLTDLRLVSRYYPSPGAVSEYIYSYVALTDLPDGAAGIFGVEDEAEDIRGHLLAFDALMELVASGEIDNAPLQLTALWLQRERPRLR